MSVRRVAGLALILGSSAAAQPTSVVQSPHNLSAGGPGPIRAASENEVCIFCHAPHNASPIRPLWNREMPTEAYTIYTSRALDAELGQPTGASKMCLSCHDGTIALGAVVSRPSPIGMAGGITVMPDGPSRIGTDLRDDHPISFRYDSSLAAQDPHLHSPAALPRTVRLDPNGELQCTSCHDAHNNQYGDFLVMENAHSALCISCHSMGRTAVAGHSDCISCHQPHGSPSGPYLLRGRTIGDTCVRCHDGTEPSAPNIASDLRKAYIHDTGSPVDPPDPQRAHASCTSCHDPHSMGSGGAAAPGLHPNFGLVGGVNGSGSPIAVATTEYEVCYACHADGNDIQPIVPRKLAQNNTRLEFSPGAASFHPVAAPGRNPDVPSLRPGWTVSSLVHCSDCHASETGASAGGSGPSGTHGSNFPPLLAARYETADLVSESAAAYALCYRCHDRSSILADESFPGHRKHIQEERTPCAACHDAHGIASTQGSTLTNSHLINFATDIVHTNPATGRLEFRDLGRFRGECNLTCHGRDHSPERY